MANSAAGIAQDSVEDSLSLLRRFFPLAYACLKPKGFLVLWLDQTHFEKLHAWATAAGFKAQRWMFIWHKTDYRSNASPQTNFTKDYEVALICRKGGATLAQVPQASSIYSCPSGLTARDFGHPFAKPPKVWQKLYSAIALPGESVYDPFMGSGSSVVAAIRQGLRPYGSELVESHFNNAILNIRKEYQERLGKEVEFE